MDYTPFVDHGAALIAGGYRIIPIRPNSKIPSLPAWQQATIGAELHAKMAGNGHARDGIGIVTGQAGPTGLAATLMDVDSRSQALADEVRIWARRLGNTVERVGEAPKIGLFYRCEPEQPKLKSRVFFDPGHEGEKAHAHALEWLLDGQQCVAYGIHPDTGRPYQQDGMLGDLAEVPLASLALVPRDQMVESVAMFEAAAERLGLVAAVPALAQRAQSQSAAGLGFLAGRPEVGIDEVRRMLGAFHPDTLDYDGWLHVGMALHHQFEGGEDGLELWDAWSQGTETQPAVAYREREDLALRWRGFVAAAENPVTLRTIIKRANDAERATAQVEAVEALQPTEQDKWGAEMFNAVRFSLETLGATPKEITQMLNLPALANCWRGVFFQPIQARFHFLNKAGGLVQLGAANWQSGLRATHGDLLTRDAKEVAARIVERVGNGDATKLAKALRDRAWYTFGRFVELYRQRLALTVEEDMFTAQSAMIITPDAVHVSYPHADWSIPAAPAAIEADVLADYREHFPLFDDVIDLLLHARFATDRRQAFLWLRCSSSWGKGFLLDGLLGRDGLGIVTSVSTKEIEGAFEGKPVGVSMENFLRSWVLYVDEFKSVKAEIKQLNNRIVASPKNQLRFEAPLYLKLFTSAETVDSLAGSEGVESQFAERFSAIELPSAARLDDRPLFVAMGKAPYRDAITSYLARRLNAAVNAMRALGKTEAARVSDTWLAGFHARHTILHGRERLDDAIVDIADEIKGLIADYGSSLLGLPTQRGSSYLDKLPHPLKQALATSIVVGRTTRSDPPIAIARRAVALVKVWIGANMDFSQAAMMRHKAAAIVALIDTRHAVTKGFYAGDGTAQSFLKGAGVALAEPSSGDAAAFFAPE